MYDPTNFESVKALMDNVNVSLYGPAVAKRGQADDDVDEWNSLEAEIEETSAEFRNLQDRLHSLSARRQELCRELYNHQYEEDDHYMHCIYCYMSNPYGN